MLSAEKPSIKLDWKGLLNPKDVKKNVRGEVFWKSNKKHKRDLVKIRLTGDYFNDHFNLKRTIASVFIQLKNENIDGITKFKLFLPGARQFFNEIFSKQKKRIYNALLNSSAKEVVDFNNVLKKLISSDERI